MSATLERPQVTHDTILPPESNPPETLPEFVFDGTPIDGGIPPTEPTEPTQPPAESVTFQPIPPRPQELYNLLTNPPLMRPSNMAEMYARYKAEMQTAGLGNYLSEAEFYERVCYCSGPRSRFVRP